MTARWTDSLARYIETKLPHASAVQVVPAGPLPAGASNATIAIDVSLTCDGETCSVPMVLRPQREDGILAPYDVARQFTIMRALGPTPVPVPNVLWLETSRDVLGTPFFLMGRLQGVRTPPLFWYSSGPAVESAAAALARIHEVDWRAAGLEELLPAGTASPLAAELHAWEARTLYNASNRVPLLEQLRRQLEAHEPSDARFCLTHGDTNAGNYLFRGDQVVAVVDWELSAIGDPRSDLGFYGALDVFFGGWSSDSNVLASAYERVTGRTLTHMEYYEAWGIYRMLLIFAGRRIGWFNPYGMESAFQRLDQLLGAGWRRT